MYLLVFVIMQDEADIRKHLDAATRQMVKAERKVKKMWAKAFDKNAQVSENLSEHHIITLSFIFHYTHMCY